MVYQKLFDHIGIDFNFGSVIEFQLFPKDFQMIFVTPPFGPNTYFFSIFITSYVTGLGNGYTRWRAGTFFEIELGHIYFLSKKMRIKLNPKKSGIHTLNLVGK